ncbi:MAG TPA: prepilin-type N-terminal cleavage/methylation domain-containing protein [Longimicrobiales bacterium]|jgi:prepilin-type N-terminal cleavage/methylation domain-containing protein
MSARDRQGFTLAELMVVVFIVGIVAGLVIPNVRKALFRADAAHIMGDVYTIRDAAHRALTETGRFPGAGGVGTVPADMESALPDGFEFQYKGVRYMWMSITLPSNIKIWGSSDLGLLWVMYPGMTELAEAMESHAGAEALWSPTQMIFIMPG